MRYLIREDFDGALTPDKDILDKILLDIGLQTIQFKTVRNPSAFMSDYGIGVSIGASSGASPTSHGGAQSVAPNSGGAQSGSPSDASSNENAQNGTSGGVSTGNEASESRQSKVETRGQKAVSIKDEKAVMRTLRKFVPVGANRGKLVLLKDEALNLDLSKNPLAFSFVLRSMFEISAKAYCTDHAGSGGPQATKADGTDRPLVAVLRDVTNHLSVGSTDKAMLRRLHGAMTELGKSDGLLSVTSMNQLVHNPRFSVTASDIALLFDNIFPLLEAMSS